MNNGSDNNMWLRIAPYILHAQSANGPAHILSIDVYTETERNADSFAVYTDTDISKLLPRHLPASNAATTQHLGKAIRSLQENPNDWKSFHQHAVVDMMPDECLEALLDNLEHEDT